MSPAYFHQPNIDPVLIHLWGPLQIRWYSLLYVGAFVVARWILRALAKEDRFKFTQEDVEQFIVWLLIGTVAGARIFYCLFYDPKNLLANPLYLFQVYLGGLSFHGGLIGSICAAILFCRKKGIPFWNFADALVLAAPTGLAMGRIGNFINGELYGRTTEVPWGVVFREGGPLPRHPSQLYEFFLEGVVLFAVLWILKNRFRRDGQLSLVFLVGYSLIRFGVEFFREPDSQLGYLTLGLSMGQLLSIAMLVISISVGFWVLQPSFNKTNPKLVKKSRPKKKI
ncbi:MAG: prolipoprotein diacylglyceryl transferase [Proteobacteria bacterium]|nr:prolipoprotein diacylglyceryl transferase [Pseudomonadota bacterium]NDC23610.1 prolipoprotein diacylglyceryl transferase [Pseudomonadota bacterium]